MAHSFENFMGNKTFHPGSWTNQKKGEGLPKAIFGKFSSTVDVGGRTEAETGGEEARGP